MFSYSGPAQLVYGDGTTAELDRVDLIETVTGGLWQWSGAATSAYALDDGAALMKLPTGAEAVVVVSNVRKGISARGASYSATLLGAEGRTA